MSGDFGESLTLEGALKREGVKLCGDLHMFLEAVVAAGRGCGGAGETCFMTLSVKMGSASGTKQ